MISVDVEPHVSPASRAESACASSMGASRATTTAASPNSPMYGARQARLSRHRPGLTLAAFQNLPLGAFRTLGVAISGPAAAPLSP
jgi:hypothetical protein